MGCQDLRADKAEEQCGRARDRTAAVTELPSGGAHRSDAELLYGYTLHLELIDLRDAGLSNYATLETATRNPALFLGLLDQTGTIEKGKRADLVLLEANPLEDIANTQKRAGVMIKGRYFTQAELNRWLDEIAPRFQHALDEKK